MQKLTDGKAEQEEEEEEGKGEWQISGEGKYLKEEEEDV